MIDMCASQLFGWCGILGKLVKRKQPLTTAIMAALWLGVMWRWRISAVASLVAISSGQLISALLEPETLPLFGLLTLLIVVRHRNNLIRLAQGRETGL